MSRTPVGPGPGGRGGAGDHRGDAGDHRGDAWPWLVGGAAADALGVAWLVVAAVVALLPALLHGHALGPYDYLARFGVTARPGVVPHNVFASDQITEMIPWNTLDWLQVHHGQLPLWNPDSVLGMPLAFNWQSSAFALPTAVGYLFPLGLSYTVTVVVTLVVAGGGVYVLGRVLGLAAVACALAAVAYELGGAFFGWLGWPIGSVFSWAGWLLAAVVVVARGRNRLPGIVFVGVVLAAAVYAGQPDALALLLATTGVFALLLVVGRLVRAGARDAGRVVLDLAVGSVLGVLLAAPLILPGAQVLGQSIRNTGGTALGAQAGLPLRESVNLFVGYVGVPFVNADGVGAVVVVLAVAGVAVARRRLESVALVGTLVVAVLLTFAEPAISLANHVPGLHAVRWPRDLVMVAALVAVLAAVGLDALVRTATRGQVRRVLVVGFPVAALLFVLAVTISTGHDPVANPLFSNPFTLGFRTRNVAWGAVQVVAGLAVAALLWRVGRGDGRSEPTARRRRRAPLVASLVLLGATTASLAGLAAPVWASTADPGARTPAERALVASVGHRTLGLGAAAGSCLAVPGLGMLPNTNLLVGLQEFAVYDPMTPGDYFSAWRRATGGPGGLAYISTFCPVVGSAVVAREFGIGDVVEAVGAPPPTGSVFVRRLGAENLFRIPGSGAATLVATAGSGRMPAATAPGRPVAVAHPSPRTWKMDVQATAPSVLRLHLTDLPGWTASLDGRPLALQAFGGVMLQARIPPGHHTVVVSYWPTTFSAGLALGALGLVAAVAALLWSRRRSRDRGAAPARPGEPVISS